MCSSHGGWLIRVFVFNKVCLTLHIKTQAVHVHFILLNKYQATVILQRKAEPDLTNTKHFLSLLFILFCVDTVLAVGCKNDMYTMNQMNRSRINLVLSQLL